MKKYRLVKQYPGSPELGVICEERNNKSKFCYFYENERNTAITKDQVENQPEYWEEVIEDKCLFKGLFFNTDGSFETIIRLSDQVHFSVGDWFYPSPKSSEPNIILELRYVSNGEFRVFGTNSCVPLDWIAPTKNKAVPYELSGNMLYSWDKVWGVHNKSFKKNFVKYGREEDGIPVYIAATEENCQWFTSKEEAEDYILMNKKHLSVNDVLKVLRLDKIETDVLKKLINERI